MAARKARKFVDVAHVTNPWESVDGTTAVSLLDAILQIRGPI